MKEVCYPQVQKSFPFLELFFLKLEQSHTINPPPPKKNPHTQLVQPSVFSFSPSFLLELMLCCTLNVFLKNEALVGVAVTNLRDVYVQF